MSTFSLSIEPVIGKSFQYGFHLGTDEKLARQIAEEKFLPATRPACSRGRSRSFAKARLVDCFYGQWQSEEI